MLNMHPRFFFADDAAQAAKSMTPSPVKKDSISRAAACGRSGRSIITPANMAESKPGVLATQCLDRRIPDKQTLPKKLRLGRLIVTKTTQKQIANSQQ
jgi:hypothetical protein